MEVNQFDSENKGFFKAEANGIKAGRMTYSRAGADKIIIDHTDVNPEFKGQGVGNKMVIAAVNFARAKNIKIIPLCPFAKSVFDKNTEIRDVL